jgi:hypothetical protein
MEGGVTHAEARMTALLDVPLRTAESEDQEIPEAFFSPVKIVLWIHWAQDFVISNLSIKGGNQSLKAVFPDLGVKLTLFH